MSVNEHKDHYDHYSAAMVARLDGFYGAVDTRMNERIASELAGCTGPVLDFGCGFGALVEHLRIRGFQAIGMDMLSFCIEAGRKRFPRADLRTASDGLASFPNKSLDAIILKDTIHHLADEGDIDHFFHEVIRVCRNKLVIFDPNPTFTLRLARWLIRHVDPVLSPRQACAHLDRYGFRWKRARFSDVLALPLSGGYVGKELVPQHSLVQRGVLLLDGLVSGLLNALRLGPLFCWRYLIVAEVPDAQRAAA